MNKIVILILYYGPFPWYFPYFLHSCRFNRDIDFRIFSDTGFEGTLPSNVCIIKKSAVEIKIIAKEKTGYEFNLDQPYKLCDLKPAYGFLLSDFIEGYDFWGYSDIDVIFGNVRNFITEQVLRDYDIITVLHDFLAGYFTIYRNSKALNELFMQSRDYPKVFESPDHFCFDECNFAFWNMEPGDDLENFYCEIDSMTHVVKRLQRKEGLRVLFDSYSLQGLGGKLKWKEGVLVYKGVYEVMLYHLIQFKKVYHRKAPITIPNHFSISPSRIY